MGRGPGQVEERSNDRPAFLPKPVRLYWEGKWYPAFLVLTRWSLSPEVM